MSSPGVSTTLGRAPGTTANPARDEPDAPGSADPPRRKANAPRRPGQGRTGKVLLGLLAWAIGLVFVTPLAWKIGRAHV